MSGRVRITLACSVCGSRNYRTTRAAKVNPGELILKKFCARCKQHTMHQETK